MSVKVTLQGYGFIMSAPAVREHTAGVSWRLTKKKRLVIHDDKGNEVARYKDAAWRDVWKVET